jgi:hypothetical protein
MFVHSRAQSIYCAKNILLREKFQKGNIKYQTIYISCEKLSESFLYVH